jgi:transcriptional regulator with XRE-family HTH domain
VSFADNLQRLRRNAGMSQTDLAQLSGTSIDTIRNWEQGRATPKIDAAGRLAKALGVTLDQLAASDDTDSGTKRRKSANPRAVARNDHEIGDTPRPPVQLPARHDVPASGPADANAGRERRGRKARKGK